MPLELADKLWILPKQTLRKMFLYAYWTPRRGRSYKMTTVCEYVFMYVCDSRPTLTTPTIFLILDPRQGRSYKITVVCLSVVCHDNQLCQFSQDWLLRFFLNLAQ